MQPINPAAYRLRPVDPILSDSAAVRMNKPDRYRALRIVPPQAVTEEHETYTIFRASIFGNSNSPVERVEGADFNPAPGIDVDSIHGSGVEYGLLDRLDLRKLARSQFALREGRVAGMVTQLATAREIRTYDAIFTAGNWPSSFAAPALWNLAAADAFSDMQDAANLVSANGMKPNRCVLSFAAANALTRNAGIKSFLPTTDNRNYITLPQLQAFVAEALGGMTAADVHIIDLTFNDAVPGLAQNLVRYGGANRWAWLGYVESDPVTAQVTEGVSVSITSEATALLRLETERMSVVSELLPTKRREEIACWHAEALQIVNPELGCLITA